MDLAASYRFDTEADTVPPPSGGQVRLNAVDQAQATLLWVSNLDAYGVDRSMVWGGLTPGASVVLDHSLAKSGASHYVAGGPATARGTYLEVAVTVVSVGSPFVDGEAVEALVAYTTPTPSLEDVRAWLGIPATQVTDDQLAQVVAAELRLQEAACRLPLDAQGRPYLTGDLVQALYRRVGREVAAKSLPLGVMGADSEYGPSRLARWDAEIDRLEGPRRVVVFG